MTFDSCNPNFRLHRNQDAEWKTELQEPCNWEPAGTTWNNNTAAYATVVIYHCYYCIGGFRHFVFSVDMIDMILI